MDVLRHALAVAKFWLEAFADPAGFVWNGDRSPHAFARDAIDALHPPAEAATEKSLARGTGRMERLRRGRAGFVEFHQYLARQALALGQPGAARAALRVLRSSDFADDVQIADMWLATLRNAHAPEDEIVGAIKGLVHLVPTADSAATE